MSPARRRAFFIACFPLSLTLSLSPAWAQPAEPVDPSPSVATLTAPHLEAAAGASVPVPVTASEVQEPIVGIQGSFSFDPAVFVVTEFSFHEAFEVTTLNVQNEQGLVRFVGTLVMDSDAEIGLGDAVLFSFTAQAVGNPGDVSAIDLTFDLVKNMAHQHLVVTVVDGSLTITGGANLPPVADFSFDPPTPKANEKVNFTDLSRDPDGFIVNWHWDFGDGGTLSVQTASAEPVMHTYAQNGVYNVTLTVTDNRGATGTATKTIRMVRHGDPRIYVFPNPCRSACNFYYEFPPSTTDIQLRVFNVRGELVYSAGLDLGTNIFRWNMRDDFGRPVPNGPYFFFATFATGQGLVRTPVDALVISR